MPDGRSIRGFVQASAMRRMRRLASDPHFASFKVFLLPDRHDLLYAVDRETARVEGVAAMRRRDRDRDRALADLDPPDAMAYRDARYPEAACRLFRDLAHLAERHLLVGLVLQMNHTPARILATGRADEGDHPARGGIGDGRLECVDVERLASDTNRP